MANKRSALKAHRQSERKHVRNRAVKSALRTYVKTARTGIAAGASEETTAAVAEAAKRLDAAANKGIIHKNQAARRKSRLALQLNALAAAASVAEVAPTTTTKRTTRTTTRTAGTTRTRSTGTTTRTRKS